MTNSLLTDERQIASIWFPGEDEVNYTVGKNGVGRISAYGEPGQCAMMPWFAIWRYGVIAERVNAAMVETVVYVEDVEEDDDY